MRELAIKDAELKSMMVDAAASAPDDFLASIPGQLQVMELENVKPRARAYAAASLGGRGYVNETTITRRRHHRKHTKKTVVQEVRWLLSSFL